MAGGVCQWWTLLSILSLYCHLELCLQYELSSTIQLNNLEFCITGDPQDDRTRGICNVPPGVGMAYDALVASGSPLNQAVMDSKLRYAIVGSEPCGTGCRLVKQPWTLIPSGNSFCNTWSDMRFLPEPVPTFKHRVHTCFN